LKVVNPTDVTHSITLIPRFDNFGLLTLELFNEVTKDKTIVSNIQQLVDGNLIITYDFVFADKDRFQIKITEGPDPDKDPVVYRGKLLATEQNPQDFKLDEGLYFF